MVNAWWFLTIFFCMATWSIETQVGGSSGGAKFGMWEKMPRIAGSHRTHWYNWKNGEWTNWKMVNSWWFLTIFLRGHLVYRNTSGWPQQPGEIWSVGGDMMNSGFIPETKQFNWNNIIEGIFLVQLPLVVKPYQMTWKREMTNLGRCI